MKQSDVIEVLKAAKQGPLGFVDPDLIPGWDYQRLCSVIGYCLRIGLVRALEITTLDSPYPEYILSGITRDGEILLELNEPPSAT